MFGGQRIALAETLGFDGFWNCCVCYLLNLGYTAKLEAWVCFGKCLSDGCCLHPPVIGHIHISDQEILSLECMAGKQCASSPFSPTALQTVLWGKFEVKMWHVHSLTHNFHLCRIKDNHARQRFRPGEARLMNSRLLASSLNEGIFITAVICQVCWAGCHGTREFPLDSGFLWNQKRPASSQRHLHPQQRRHNTGRWNDKDWELSWKGGGTHGCWALTPSLFVQDFNPSANL